MTVPFAARCLHLYIGHIILVAGGYTNLDTTNNRFVVKSSTLGGGGRQLLDSPMSCATNVNRGPIFRFLIGNEHSAPPFCKILMAVVMLTAGFP